jgi:hypothetical protein
LIVNDFRTGTVLYQLQTGDTPVSSGTFSSIDYPVFRLKTDSIIGRGLADRQAQEHLCRDMSGDATRMGSSASSEGRMVADLVRTLQAENTARR